MDTRTATISGVTTIHAVEPEAKFTIKVSLERRDAYIYYTWRAETIDGEFLWESGHSIALVTIPKGKDAFESALAHATENIKRKGSNRKPVFTVTKVVWNP